MVANIQGALLMGCCISRARTASIDFTPALNQDPSSGESHSGRSSNERRTAASPGATARSIASPLSDLSSRNRPETAVAQAVEHVRNPHHGLLKLPCEIICQIAHDLRPGDVTAFADTCRSLRYTLAQDKRSAVLIARAQAVRTPSEARRLLSDIHTDISRSHLRSRPLAALAMTMNQPGFGWSWDARPPLRERRPTTERVELFDSIRTAVMQVPADHRCTPLVLLVSTLVLLPASERTVRYETMLHQIAPLSPQDRATSLREFAIQLTFLDGAAQQAMFGAVIEQARQLPAKLRGSALQALAPSLRYLPERTSKFITLTQEMMQLPAPYQIASLAKLSIQIRFIDTIETPATFNAFIEHIRRLPDAYRAEALEALAPDIPDMPEPVAKFDALLEETRQLPAPYQGSMLQALALSIHELPEPAARFDTLLEKTRQLPAADQGPTLKVLAWTLGTLPEAAQPAAFEGAIRDLEQLAPEQRNGSLTVFAWQIRRLAQSARAAAFDHVYRVAGHLDNPQERARRYAELVRRIACLPSAARMQRYDQMMVAIRQLPRQFQAEPMAMLDNVPLPD
jgi:hypothetical protein